MAAPGAAGVGAGSVTRVLRCRADGAGSRPDRGTAEGKVSAWEDGVVPVSVVVTSDTHVPRRARDLPHDLWAAIDASDVVVHAGDWVDVALLDRLAVRARAVARGGCVGWFLRSVASKRPPARVGGRLPEVARAEIEGLRVAVVHETGD